MIYKVTYNLEPTSSSIELIKSLRNVLGCSLKTAKETADAIRAGTQTGIDVRESQADALNKTGYLTLTLPSLEELLKMPPTTDPATTKKREALVKTYETARLLAEEAVNNDDWELLQHILPAITLLANRLK